jgi:hypothetical protein
MTGAKKGNSTPAAQRELIALPKWLPSSVEKQVRQIEERTLPAEQRVILVRLATDDRMRKVWSELLRRSRSGEHFFYPAKRFAEMSSLTPDEIQAQALSEILHFAFCAARDKIAVSKPEDVARAKEELIPKAQILCELAEMREVSSFTIERAIPDAASRQLAITDAMALLRVARWLEHIAKTNRKYIAASSSPPGRMLRPFE